MIEVLLWDNDGVLVDSERAFFETTRAAFESAGLELTVEYWARHYLGAGRRSIEIAQMLGASPHAAHRLIEERNRAFGERLEFPIPVLPGIPETLARLSSRRRMAVVTGSPRRQFDLIHKHTGLLPFFECVVTADDCEREKPNPEAYLTVLRRLGVDGRACLAVEDSPRGLASATGAGVPCVVLRTAFTDVKACGSACAILEDVCELDGVIQEREQAANDGVKPER